MATEIGKAYLQIVPSAKGIGANIEKMYDGESEKAGTSIGKKIGSGILRGLSVLAAGKALFDTIMEGSKLQQSIGGIETLFGTAAEKVKKNAEKAFQTAGVSANEYMEHVTSFSASLLQSLSGDTNKAADTADMAMRDMSDNANKMGTSMTDIQNAYQGFAKQNYTIEIMSAI